MADATLSDDDALFVQVIEALAEYLRKEGRQKERGEQFNSLVLEFKQLLRAWRLRGGLTRPEASYLIRLSGQSMFRWESETDLRPPHIDSLARLRTEVTKPSQLERGGGSGNTLPVCKLPEFWGLLDFGECDLWVINPRSLRPDGVRFLQPVLEAGTNIYIVHWPEVGGLPDNSDPSGGGSWGRSWGQRDVWTWRGFMYECQRLADETTGEGRVFHLLSSDRQKQMMEQSKAMDQCIDVSSCWPMPSTVWSRFCTTTATLILITPPQYGPD